MESDTDYSDVSSTDGDWEADPPEQLPRAETQHVLPQLYKFGRTCYGALNDKEQLNTKKVELEKVQTLCRMSTSDLLSHAWDTGSNGRGVNKSCLYEALPDCPVILDSRFVDAYPLSRFMCDCTVALNKRMKDITLYSLRASLCGSILEEALDVCQSSEKSGDALCSSVELKEETTRYHMLPDDGITHTEDEMVGVTSFDFTVALTLGEKLTDLSIKMVSQLVERCFRMQQFESLASWGVHQIAMKVMESITSATEASTLSISLELLVKLCVGSGDANFLMDFFQWYCKSRSETIDNTFLQRLSPVLHYLRESSLCRVRVHLPLCVENGIRTPIKYLSSGVCVDACCVVDNDGTEALILFSEKGAIKILLDPPYALVCSNSDIVATNCINAVVEEDGIMLQLKDEQKLMCVDKNSLEERHVAHIPALGKKHQIYVGNGKFAEPHYSNSVHKEKFLKLTGFHTSGRTILSRRTMQCSACDCVGVQFSLLVEQSHAESSLQIVTMNLNNHCLIDVSVKVHPSRNYYTVLFKHGAEVTAEVREYFGPSSRSWTTWSASLATCPSNGHHVLWKVYRNDVPHDCQSSSGYFEFFPSVPESDEGLSICLLEGTFSGFVSSLLVWHQDRSVEHMKPSSTGHTLDGVLLNVGMNEGVGCTLHSSCGGFTWVNTNDSIHWAIPPQQLSRENRSRAPWYPEEEVYWCLVGEKEVAIIGPSVTTWIDHDGVIIEQAPSTVSPFARCCKSPTNGTLVALSKEGEKYVAARFEDTNASPITKDAIKGSLSNLEALVAGYQKNGYCTFQSIMVSLAHQMNTAVRATFSGTARRIFGDMVLTQRTIAGLVSVLTTLSSTPGLDAFHLLLLSITARLLLKELSCKKSFPSSIVDAVVMSTRNITGWTMTCSDSLAPLYVDAQESVAQLYEMVIAEGTSHDYKVSLLLTTESLTSVQRLLAHKSITSLVLTMIQTNDQSKLMQLLKKLKQWCVTEAEDVIRAAEARPCAVSPSSPMLSALLCLLGQRWAPQWHVIASAALQSLARVILKKFESVAQENADPAALSDLLRRTALGTVIFPCVHMLNRVCFDTSILGTIAESLQNLLKCLQVFAARTSHLLLEASSLTRFSFSESHSIVIPSHTSAGPFVHELQLSHATQVVVEVDARTVPSRPASPTAHRDGQQTPSPSFPASTGDALELTLLGTDLQRYALTTDRTGRGTFPVGGTLKVYTRCPAAHAGRLIVVQGAVELVLRDNAWLADLQLATSKCLLTVTDAMLSFLPDEHEIMAHQSFLRGGLSAAGLTSTGSAESPSASTLGMPLSVAASSSSDLSPEEAGDLSILCGIAEAKETRLSGFWADLYARKRMTFGSKLEKVMRWCCCALAWHILHPPPTAPLSQEYTHLKEALNTAMDVMKRKALVLREALQQDKEESIITRARFLLIDVTPPHRSNAIAAALQQTETPVVTALPTPFTGLLSGQSMSMSRFKSRASLSVQPLGWSSRAQPSAAGFSTSRASRHRRMDAAREAFQQTIALKKWAIEAQITNFMVLGVVTTVSSTWVSSPTGADVALNAAANTAALKAIMGQKLHLAAVRTKAYDLLHYIVSLHSRDESVIQDLCISYLRCRRRAYDAAEHIAASPSAPRVNAFPGSSSSPSPVKSNEEAPKAQEQCNYHYNDVLIGCGMQKELEHQKKACLFIRRLLKAVLLLLDNSPTASGAPSQAPSFPILPCLSMCAILCHPWDTVDLAMLPPEDIFSFLTKLLSKSLNMQLKSFAAPEADDSSESRKGLVDLCYRHSVVPNRILPVYETGISVVDGDVQGVHVEATAASFSARHCWGLPRRGPEVEYGEPHSPSSPTSTAAAADVATPAVGLACVMPPFPEVYYFEITVEVLLRDSTKLELGVTPFALSSGSGGAMEQPKDYVSFTSQGVMQYRSSTEDPEELVFSGEWTEGDVIGCGVFRESGGVFFTRNGTFLGIAKRCRGPQWERCLPTLSLSSPKGVSVVLVNFGLEKPFHFDVSSVHSSCRHHYLTPSTASDACFMTAEYLLTTAYENLAAPEENTSYTKDSVSRLLECAATFLSRTIIELVELMNSTLTTALEGKQQVRSIITKTILRFFHSVSAVIECFDFGEHVTRRTDDIIFQLCAVALSTSHVKAIKTAASQCIGRMQNTLPDDRFAECVRNCPSTTPEDIISDILLLSRTRFVRDVAPRPVPRWEGGSTLVKGNGTFVGEAPLPSSGRHIIGFRISKENLRAAPGSTVRRGQTGESLGGGYYVGLCRGKPSFQKPEHFLRRSDIFVLQDMDDKDRVPHLLLQRDNTPPNKFRRTFGHNDSVWVEWNADAGEISFFRDQVPLGLAFANLPALTDLHAFAFLYNPTASCEIMAHEPLHEGPVEGWSVALRRSVAVHTLQQLHTSSVFAPWISFHLQRAVPRLESAVEDCTTALAVLGGESSYCYCQHKTYGLVVVAYVDEALQQAAVHISSDEEKRLFSVELGTLTPTFVKTPIHVAGTTESATAAALLADTLSAVVDDASGITLLQRDEEAHRRRLEHLQKESIDAVISHSWIGIAMAHQEEENERLRAREAYQQQRMQLRQHMGRANREITAEMSSPADSEEEAPVKESAPSPGHGSSQPSFPLENSPPAHPHATAASVRFNPPITVERHASTSTVYVPSSCPSIAVAHAGTPCSTIRGSALGTYSAEAPADPVTFRVVLSALSPDEPFYVGVGVAQKDRMPAPRFLLEARQMSGTWLLCSVDSAETNHSQCCARAGTLSSPSSPVLCEGDTALFTLDRGAGTLSCERHRKVGAETMLESFGVLFRKIPADVPLQPMVVCGPGTVIVFSCEDGVTLPQRQVFAPVNSVVGSSSTTSAAAGPCCAQCHASFSPTSHSWFESCASNSATEGKTLLCSDCFHNWQRPLLPFARKGGRQKRPLAPFMALHHTPLRLCQGNAVEFYEYPTANTWSAAKSVNVFYLPLEQHRRPADMPNSSSFFTCISSTTAGAAVANAEHALAISEPLIPVGAATALRVDWTINFLYPSIAAEGCSFKSLQPFFPLWYHRAAEEDAAAINPPTITAVCDLTTETVAFSSTTIPSTVASLYGVLCIKWRSVGADRNFHKFFIGVTTRDLRSMPNKPVKSPYLQHLVEAGQAAGKWMTGWSTKRHEEGQQAEDAVQEVYFILDHRQHMMAFSDSLEHLHTQPEYVSYEDVAGGRQRDEYTDRVSLRLLFYSTEPCTLSTAAPGVAAHTEDGDNDEAAVVAGLIPENFFAGAVPPFTQDIIAAARCADASSVPPYLFLSDTVAHTEALYPTGRSVWSYAAFIDTRGGRLIDIGDALTLLLVRESRHNLVTRVEVFSQGRLVAWTKPGVTLEPQGVPAFTSASLWGRGRLAVWTRRPGLSARFIPPVYGASHIGTIVQALCDGAVGVAETTINNRPQRFVVRREDVRLCALSAVHEVRYLKAGTPVLFSQPRSSSSGWCTGSVKSDGQRIRVHREEPGPQAASGHLLQRDQVFLLDNQGPPPAAHDWGYQSLLPPEVPVIHEFAVGHQRYRTSLDSLAGFNGLMFDCLATSPVELAGIKVFTRAAGSHHVDVFFKVNTLIGAETREAEWIPLYSGTVDPSNAASPAFYGCSLTNSNKTKDAFPLDLTFPSPPQVEGGTFALYIHASLTGLCAYGMENGCQEELGAELDKDSVLVVFVGKQTTCHQPFGGNNCPKGFRGTIRYRRKSYYPQPYLDLYYREGASGPSEPKKVSPLLPSPQGLVSLKELEKENETVRLICRQPPRTVPCQHFSFTLEVLTGSLWLKSLKLPVVFGDRGSGQQGATPPDHRCVVTIFISQSTTSSGSIERANQGGWVLLWNNAVSPKAEFEMVVMERTKPIQLTKGVYTLFLCISVPSAGFPTEPCTGASFLAADPADQYACTNGTSLGVTNFFGEMCVTLPLPVRQEEEVEGRGGGGVTGERREMATGVTGHALTCSASGIMFDLHADRHVALEELYCTTQSSARDVKVKVFWKKDSMVGYEDTPSAWRLLSEQDLNLFEGKLFSLAGPGAALPILRAGHTYAMFIQMTGGTFSVRCNPGRREYVAAPAETDGVLTVHVGKNCTTFEGSYSASCVLKGRIVYRTVSFEESIGVFTLARSFLLTRVLVALLSCVDSRNAVDLRLQDRVLQPLSQLVLFPRPSIPQLDEAERHLWSLLQRTSPEDFTEKVVTLALGEKSLARCGDAHSGPAQTVTLRPLDVALLVPTTADLGNPTVVCIAEETLNPLATIDRSEHLYVRNATSSTAFKVRARDLIPISMCWMCRQPYAISTFCPVAGTQHTPPKNAASRLQEMISNAIGVERRLPPAQAAYCARLLLSARIRTVEQVSRDIRPQTLLYDAASPPCARCRGTSAVFSVPVCKLMVEAENQMPGCERGAWPFYGMAQRIQIGEEGLYLWLRVRPLQDDVEVVALGRWERPLYCGEGTLFSVAIDVETEAEHSCPHCTKPPASSAAATCPPASVLHTVVHTASDSPSRIEELGRQRIPRSQCELLQRHGAIRWRVAVKQSTLPKSSSRGGDPSAGKQPRVLFSIKSLQGSGASSSPGQEPDNPTGITWMGGEREAIIRAEGVTFLNQFETTDRQPRIWGYLCVDTVEYAAPASGATDTASHLSDDIPICLNVHSTCKDKGQNASLPDGHAKSFGVFRGEILLLHWSKDGFSILDTADTIHIHIPTLGNPVQVGFSLCGPYLAKATLCGFPLLVARAYMLYNCNSLHTKMRARSAGAASDSTPYWDQYDPIRLLRTADGSRRYIQQTGVGSNMALGSVLAAPCFLGGAGKVLRAEPSNAYVSFAVQVLRTDRPQGTPLDGGHFVGVALDTFALGEGEKISFKNMKSFTGSVWALQDTQDEDSMPNQLPVRPVANTADICFLSGTALEFRFYPLRGCLEVIRDQEAPQMVYTDIPIGAHLRPFVLLDNEAAAAKLSEGTVSTRETSSFRCVDSDCSVRARTQDPVPLWGSQTLTETLLRAVPFAQVRDRCPLWRRLLGALPLRTVQTLMEVWQVPHTHTLFNYRLSSCIATGISLGWFEAGPAVANNGDGDAQEDRSNILTRSSPSVVDSAMKQHILLLRDEKPVAFETFPSDEGQDRNAPPITFALPSDTVPLREMRHQWRDLCITHLAAWSPETDTGARGAGMIRQTLWHLRRPFLGAYILECDDGLVPHPHVVSQVAVLTSVKQGPGKAAKLKFPHHAVVVNEWYDCQLSSLGAQTEKLDMIFILRSVLCAIEHYHLHGRIHGRVCPENVLLALSHGALVRCALGHYYRPVAAVSAITPSISIVPAPDAFSRSLTSYSVNCELAEDPFNDVWCCLYMVEQLFPHAFSSEAAREGWAALWADARGNHLTSSALIEKYRSFLGLPPKTYAIGPLLSVPTAPPCVASKSTRGASSSAGSTYGIMFDVVAKSVGIRITKISAHILAGSSAFTSGGPSSTARIGVRLYTKAGSFQGHERNEKAWMLADNVQLNAGQRVSSTNGMVQLDIEEFDPIEVAAGERVAILLHTSSRCVSIASESDGVRAEHGKIAQENDDIGITVGKPIDEHPFTGRIQERKCMLSGNLAYIAMTHSTTSRSTLTMFSNSPERDNDLRRRGHIPSYMYVYDEKLPASGSPTKNEEVNSQGEVTVGVVLHRSRTQCLLLLPTGRVTWRQRHELEEVPPDAPAEEDALSLLPALDKLVSEWIENRNNFIAVACRPLLQSPTGLDPLLFLVQGSSLYVGHPRVTADGLAVSEPITTSCTISLWSESGTLPYTVRLLQLELNGEEGKMPGVPEDGIASVQLHPKQEGERIWSREDAVFLYVDLPSNTVTNLGTGRRTHFCRSIAAAPLCLEVSLHEADGGQARKIHAFIKPWKTFWSGLPNVFEAQPFLESEGPGLPISFYDQLPEPMNPSFNWSNTKFQPQLATAVKRDHCVFLSPLNGNPMSVSVYELSATKGTSVGYRVNERVITSCTETTKWSIPDHVQAVVCDVRTQYDWYQKSIPILQSRISAVEMTGHRIMHIGPRDSHPAIVPLQEIVFDRYKAHRLIFRVLSPRKHPVEIGICERGRPEAGNSEVSLRCFPLKYTWSTETDNDIIAMIDPLETQSTIVHMQINVFSNSAFAHSSTGLYYEIFRGETVRCSELQLVMTFKWPGSSVELLHWETSETTRNDATTSNVSAVQEKLEKLAPSLPFLSVTVPLDPGSLRCPPLATGIWDVSHQLPQPQDTAATSGKWITWRMEHFITSYAHFLAERLLVTAEEPPGTVAVPTERSDSLMTTGQWEGSGAAELLHRFILYTSVYRRPDLMKEVVRTSLKHSVGLVSHAVAYLMQPMRRQQQAGVDSSLQVLRCFMEDGNSHGLLSTPLGPSLALLCLRTAVVQKGELRNVALRCAERLLASRTVPLPSSRLLRIHLYPLQKAIGALCKRQKMRCGIVQIGVTMVSSLMDRYAAERPGEVPPGAEEGSIPYPLIFCARRIVECLLAPVPQALPASFGEVCRAPRFVAKMFPVRDEPNGKKIIGTIFSWRSSVIGADECPPVSEMNRTDTIRVTISGRRNGRLVIGWHTHFTSKPREDRPRLPLLDSRCFSEEQTQLEEMRMANPQELLLPSVGYAVERDGSVLLCTNGCIASKLDVEVESGDVLAVSCAYERLAILLKVKRGGKLLTRTTVHLDDGCTPGLPSLMFWHGDIASVTTAPDISLCALYDQAHQFPDVQGTDAAQSLDFYTELNKFCEKMGLGDPFAISSSNIMPSGSACESDVFLPSSSMQLSAHDVAAFPHLSRFLKVSASESQIPLERLGPYLRHLHLFDHVVDRFSPLINLRQPSELLDLFKVLRRLCAPATKNQIQNGVLKPFIERQTRGSIPVTIHTMIARPVAELSISQTLMRSIFGQLYMQFHMHPPTMFYNTPLFVVKLSGFGSTDAGGPYREMLSQLAAEINTPHPFHPGYQQNPLFINVAEPDYPPTIMPNPAIQANSQAPLMLEFFGKLLASCFRSPDLLAVQFPALFWKLLQGEEVVARDLACLFPNFIEQVSPSNLQQYTAEEVEEQFPGCAAEMVRRANRGPIQFPLALEGDARLLARIIVTHEVEKYKEAISYIQTGFERVTPLYVLLAFQPEEVECRVCGSPELSAEDFLNQCTFTLSPKDEGMFRRFVYDISDEDRTLLLRFATGQSRLPLRSPMKVQPLASTNTLPTSGTCFYVLRIPTYTSETMMRERILYAIRQCSAIDADNVTRDEMILLS